MHELIRDITLCILLARVLGPLAHFFRQPLILAYLIAGFLIGPFGAGCAGVSLSTFPYALDVTGKVTTLRDFFITLFFVALGMTIPIPNLSMIGLALIIAGFTIFSRVVTTFAPLYLMKQGCAPACCRRSTWRRSASFRWS